MGVGCDMKGMGELRNLLGVLLSWGGIGTGTQGTGELRSKSRPFTFSYISYSAIVSQCHSVPYNSRNKSHYPKPA